MTALIALAPQPAPARAARRLRVFAALASLAAPGLFAQPTANRATPPEFPLVGNGRAADLIYAPEDFKAVSLAVSNLAADIEHVSGVRPAVRTNWAARSGPAVLIGTLGHSRLLDRAPTEAIATLSNQWESFVIAPAPGKAPVLLVAGSDRRGAAFGAYEISRRIGVSPWYWWADVTPAKKETLLISGGLQTFGPPSVKYRGIFINDEDWGLQPWAARTFEPENGGIGPKTYAKVFELLLRLRANTLWPAMHPGTRPFNSSPENRALADAYGIVMGSSHAEPMLRNNVGEWTNSPESYNYAVNRPGVLAYWEERVAQNGRFENLYTLGMRGIHDSAMQGPQARPEQIRLLEQIFDDQRGVLDKYVAGGRAKAPQMFCPYKEVLDLYRGGLKVPEDVTLLFPDDNFGYIRTFPTPEERRRAGGCGAYYHLSYLGRPLSYLWLCTTPPALVREEMSKAYDCGARTIWIVNVGDLKPAEIGTEFFMDMAWDIRRRREGNSREFLTEWAAREFGADSAFEIAGVLDRYYRLNYQRKPEHLQWWMPNQPPQPSPLTDDEVRDRLGAFAELQTNTDRIAARLPAEKRDAFFELVQYPVGGSALANQRCFLGERGSPEAAEAHQKLLDLTRRFNEQIAGGKWRRLMALEPADKQWSGMRIAAWSPPEFPRPALPARTNAASSPAAPARPVNSFTEREGLVSMEAEHFTARVERGGGRWEVMSGLGRTGDSVAVLPFTAPGWDATNLPAGAPALEYQVRLSSTGKCTASLYFIPTHPIVPTGLRVGIGMDDQPPQIVQGAAKDGSAEWARGVLEEAIIRTSKLQVASPGPHTLRVYAIDPGVVLDKIVLGFGEPRPSYLGPAETREGN